MYCMSSIHLFYKMYVRTKIRKDCLKNKINKLGIKVLNYYINVCNFKYSI